MILFLIFFSNFGNVKLYTKIKGKGLLYGYLLMTSLNNDQLIVSFVSFYLPS